MLKLVLFGALISLAVAQFDIGRLMMMQMMQNSGSSQTGTSTGTGTSLDAGITNAELCRNTDNLVFIPCATFTGICDMISMRTYNMPNMLSCSALGTGCCIKDMATLMLVRNMAK